MFVLGHVGLTLGTAVLITGGLASCRPLKVNGSVVKKSPSEASKSVISRLSFPLRQISSWLSTLGDHLDTRFILVGALLPDIIDKPIAYLFSTGTFETGRLYSHTLLFVTLITLAGLFLFRIRAELWLLTLAFGSLTHLIFDQMWLTPKTLLWPFFDTTFHANGVIPTEIPDYLPFLVDNLTTYPGNYIPEITGGLILVWFGWILLRRKKLLTFIRRGKIS